MTSNYVRENINVSRKRMDVASLDMLQFHWCNILSLICVLLISRDCNQINSMKHNIAFQSLPLAVAFVNCTNAIVYKATNNATGTPGGDRFSSEIGLQYIIQPLVNTSSFIWTTFNQSDTERKNISIIALTIKSMEGVAYTTDNGIYMSSEYIGNYTGEVKVEFTRIMFHEMTHVWQWNGEGKAPLGLIEGVSDFVRMKAGYVPGHWVKPGGGNRWDEGYDVTARFFDYCDGKKSGFVAELNEKMKSGYSDGYFEELLGCSMDELWKEYKEMYGG